MVTQRSASSFAAAMSAIAVVMLALVPSLPHAQTTVAAAGECPALLDREFSRLQTGKPESLCQYRGKVLLIVNTASYCGYTHQYEGLEALYRKYKDRGLVVLGFPSNDFGAQEPGSNKEIAEFCRLTYGVEFPMFEKSSVTSLRTNPLYADLLARTGQAPKWNFHKYLIDRNGNAAGTFASGVEPNDRQLLVPLEKLLDDKPATPKG
jgi:glutathione peroxidase